MILLFNSVFVRSLNFLFLFLIIIKWSAGPLISAFVENTRSCCLDLKFLLWAVDRFGWDLITHFGESDTEWSSELHWNFFWVVADLSRSLFIWSIILKVFIARLRIILMTPTTIEITFMFHNFFQNSCNFRISLLLIFHLMEQQTPLLKNVSSHFSKNFIWSSN